MAHPSKPKPSQEDVAYRAIIRTLAENQVRPGDLLLETTLAEDLGLSRTPVSHALARLHAEGFLEKRSKRGYLIPFPNPEDARQVFAVRRLLEGQAAEEAAAAFRPEQGEALEQLLADGEDSTRRMDKERVTSVNEGFHLGIARLSGNPYLERFVRQIFWRSNLYIFFFDGFYRVFADGFYRDRAGDLPPQKTPEQHRRIAEAIQARDPERAGRLMRDHIQHTYDRMLAVLRA